VDGEGKELLHLTCSKCEDGTLATLDGVSVTFKRGGDKGAEADLPLAKPLVIGNNPLSIALVRPGLGRNEVVPITVAVPYRLRPRLDSLGANSGQGPVAIEVELQEGAKLTLGGEAVAVDARGHGMKDVALGAENEGTTGESKVIDKGVDYVFRGPDSSEDRGAVRIKATILPLVIDSPPLHWVTEGRSVWIAGRTAKGAAVFVGKDRATLQGDGSFTHKVDLPKGSEQSLVVRVQSEGFVPRIARMAVKQVDSLRAEGKVFEAKASEATGLLGNDAVTADIRGAVGKPMVVEGEVLQETIQGLQSILLIDNRRGCAKGPCVVRVVTVKDDRFQKGSVWKAFGYVTKPFPTNSGTMVPEVEASFLTPR
jgi:hypothetical protein